MAVRKSHFGVILNKCNVFWGDFTLRNTKKYEKHNFYRITLDCILEVAKLLHL